MACSRCCTTETVTGSTVSATLTLQGLSGYHKLWEYRVDDAQRQGSWRPSPPGTTVAGGRRHRDGDLHAGNRRDDTGRGAGDRSGDANQAVALAVAPEDVAGDLVDRAAAGIGHRLVGLVLQDVDRPHRARLAADRGAVESRAPRQH